MALRTHNLIEPLTSEWEHLARHTGAAPFLWPGWIEAWWRAFGKGSLQILTVYENSHLSGVLPLQRLRGALLSPTNPHTPLFGLLAATETATERLARALFAQRPRCIELSYLDPDGSGASLTRTAATAARYQVFEESIGVAPYVATDGPWDAYERGLRRKFRSEIRRRKRRLEEEGRLTLEVSDGKEGLESLLEEGFSVEGSGWKEYYGTSIRSAPPTRRFYTEVARWASERGWLRLAFLRLNGRALAFDYCLESNATHYLLKTGYDPAYRRYGPGMIIRHLMLSRAFSGEITTYDFLGEGYGWKQEWTGTLQKRQFLHMFAPTASGVLNRMMFMYARPASEWTKDFARSVLGERKIHLLKRGRAIARTPFSR